MTQLLLNFKKNYEKNTTYTKIVSRNMTSIKLKKV